MSQNYKNMEQVQKLAMHAVVVVIVFTLFTNDLVVRLLGFFLSREYLQLLTKSGNDTDHHMAGCSKSVSKKAERKQGKGNGLENSVSHPGAPPMLQC
jgi:hypothetical protein